MDDDDEKARRELDHLLTGAMRDVVVRFWKNDPGGLPFLEKRAAQFEQEQRQYLETSAQWRVVQWYRDAIAEAIYQVRKNLGTPGAR